MFFFFKFRTQEFHIIGDGCSDLIQAVRFLTCNVDQNTKLSCATQVGGLGR